LIAVLAVFVIAAWILLQSQEYRRLIFSGGRTQRAYAFDGLFHFLFILF